MGLLTPETLRRGRTLKHDVAEAVVQELQALGAEHVLDIGCGTGGIAARLAARGLRVTGIDPSETLLQAARRRVPEARLIRAGIEAPPADLGRFDAAIMVNSLHHVAPEHMRPGLENALAALRPGGRLLLCEPAATGSFFRVMQPVEDETEVRALAIAAIESVLADRRAELIETRCWDRESVFDGLEGFVDYLATVAPERIALAERNRAELRRAWRENIEQRDGRAVLVQPILCWMLAVPPA